MLISETWLYTPYHDVKHGYLLCVSNVSQDRMILTVHI